MKLHYLQHVPFEGPASIEEWAKAKGWSLSPTRLFAGEPPPNIDGFDWLIIMGGPMNVDDEEKYPWLAQEKRLIERAIKAEKVVLGICLGAQLIATVLGAKVFPNRYKEIGWFPINLTPDALRSPLLDFLPQRLTAFHWHGDTFDLPQGARRLAESEGCANQAFLYGDRVLALQCHLESTKASVQELIAHCGHELVTGRYIQTAESMLGQDERFSIINQAMFGVLDRLAEQAAVDGQHMK